ncbi:MAG: hypothetical protein HKN87_13150 [Saprospiraceae bacterium]|nr:hypothetical protein [Saprospiraceae bacterium]
MPENLALKIVSLTIVCIGTVILLISWFNLGTKPSLGMAKIELETGGFYHCSRNPQLLGYGIMLIAPVILFFSWLTLLWFSLYLIISYFMVKSEEEFLEQTYQAKYKKYCMQVPRIMKLKK